MKWLKNFFRNKKGQSAESLFAVVLFLVVFGFLSIFGYLLLTQYIDGFTAAGLYDGKLQEAGEGFLFGLGLIDKIMVLILVIFIIGIGYTNYRVAAEPIGFIVTFFMAAFYGFISYFFNFIFIELVNQSVFSSTLLAFPITILICTNLHWIMLVNIIVGSITLYAKQPKGQFIE